MIKCVLYIILILNLGYWAGYLAGLREGRNRPNLSRKEECDLFMRLSDEHIAKNEDRAQEIQADIGRLKGMQR